MNHRLSQLLSDLNTLLPLSEVFGPTIQGEGPYTGRRAVFIRLGGCNLSCTWCDTPYTWDHTRFDVDRENPMTPAGEIVDRAVKHPAGLFVVTGGEPLVHQRRPGMVHLLRGLNAYGPVHIETNGTIAPDREITDVVEFFVASPKLSNNGADPEKRRIRASALARFAQLAHHQRACFKFVVRDRADIVEVADVVQAHHIPAGAVWLMPEGTTAGDVVGRHRDIAAAAIHQGWNTTTRLHTLIWGDERGR